MLFSIVTPIAVFVLALGASYVITRPIGDLRRHIAATVLSLAMGTIGGFITASMVISFFAALSGAFVGIIVAWRRRNPVGEPQVRSNPQWHSSKRSRHGISRA
jgi:uncharacterized iron-regulated membrane protein